MQIYQFLPVKSLYLKEKKQLLAYYFEHFFNNFIAMVSSMPIPIQEIFSIYPMDGLPLLIAV
jgi:hypothetical protein